MLSLRILYPKRVTRLTSMLDHDLAREMLVIRLDHFGEQTILTIHPRPPAHFSIHTSSGTGEVRVSVFDQVSPEVDR